MQATQQRETDKNLRDAVLRQFVDWNYQRVNVEETARSISGVRGVKTRFD